MKVVEVYLVSAEFVVELFLKLMNFEKLRAQTA
jgi:hypothetical protein